MFCLLNSAGSPRFPAIPPSKGSGWPKQWRLVSRSIKPWVGIRSGQNRRRPLSSSAALCAHPLGPTGGPPSLESGARYAICRWLNLLLVFRSHFDNTTTWVKIQTKPGGCFSSHTLLYCWKLYPRRAQSRKKSESARVMQLLRPPTTLKVKS